MRSRIVYCLILILAAFSCRAQTWSPVGLGITGTAANTTWSLFAYDSILYTGGRFSNAGAITANDIAQWDGTTWGTTGTGSSGFVSAMAEYSGSLYAAGKFDTMGGSIAHDIAMWNGTTWAPVGKGIKANQYGVYCMATYNGKLYAGGSFDSAGGKLVFGIAQWDGTNWSSLGSGIYAADEDDGVFALAVYNGDLYVAGGIDSAGGIPVSEIAKWDGSTWTDIGMYTNAAIYSLAVYNGNLYAGGYFDTIGGVPTHRIAMWNGATWSGLDSGITGESGWAIINSLAVYHNELFVGGYFDTVDGKPTNCIAKWNGSAWSSVGSGINIGGGVDAITVFDDALYVGGGFDSAGGVYAKNIAMWTNPSAINEPETKSAIPIYPNPASNYLTVTTSIHDNYSEYKIYNIYGQLEVTGKLYPGTNTVDIQKLSCAVYLFVLNGGNASTSYKFLKE